MLALVAVLAGVLSACNAGFSAPPFNGPLQPDSGKHDSGNLTGAGSTLAAIIYQAWLYDYHHDVSSNVQVNYQPIGSGAGIQQFIEGSIDFGATDTPMTDAQVKVNPNIQHLPTLASAVVLTYELSLQKPTVQAATQDSTLPPGYRSGIVNASGAGAYPISTYTFLLINKHYQSCDRARVLLHVIWWTYDASAAQADAHQLQYVALPASLQSRVDATLHAVSCGHGEKVLR